MDHTTHQARGHLADLKLDWFGFSQGIVVSTRGEKETLLRTKVSYLQDTALDRVYATVPVRSRSLAI